MIKKTTFIALLLAMCWQVKAQDTNEQTDITRYRWDVGTDLLWLINKNTLPATSVFVRYNVQPENRLPGAVRLRLGMDWSVADSTQLSRQPKDKINRFAPFIRLGYEWQHRKDRYEFFYGVDIQYSYSCTRIQFIMYDNPPYSFDGTQKSWEIGTVGFIGIKFFLSSHISFSTEASYSILYRRIRDYNERLPYPNDIGTGPTFSKIDVDEWKGKFN